MTGFNRLKIESLNSQHISIVFMRGRHARMPLLYPPLSRHINTFQYVCACVRCFRGSGGGSAGGGGGGCRCCPASDARHRQPPATFRLGISAAAPLHACHPSSPDRTTLCQRRLPSRLGDDCCAADAAVAPHSSHPRSHTRHSETAARNEFYSFSLLI